MFSLQPPDSICRTLGGRVRAMRLARNLSQQELARMTGASLSSVRRFEAAGQGTLGLVVRIAQALHVVEDLDALFVVRPQSIAQAQAQQRPVRQRARRTAGAAQHRS